MYDDSRIDCYGCSCKFEPVDKRQIYCSKTCRSRDYSKTRAIRKGKEYKQRSPKQIYCRVCLKNRASENTDINYIKKDSPRHYTCKFCGSTYSWDERNGVQLIKESEE